MCTKNKTFYAEVVQHVFQDRVMNYVRRCWPTHLTIPATPPAITNSFAPPFPSPPIFCTFTIVFFL